MGICQRFTDRQFQTCVEANVLDLNSRYEEASKIKTLAVLDQIREQRGCPVFLRMENGPEFIAETLRDWCKDENIQVNICDPGSPWQNGRVESVNSRFRGERSTREVFDSMWEIRFMLEAHHNNYNHHRPHSALAYLTPVEFATKWLSENCVLAS